ncbi:hypothetical protein KQX54_015996 [Cotesia glomerata]|uniref:Uncharacterized protein n=1 Tax=Cotesia glomerata TaxID=32391 RepID=A0AAV7HY08_COTGL|nr:hypothetical protein KQX54_015996 [Cotesia glomerata]
MDSMNGIKYSVCLKVTYILRLIAHEEMKKEETKRLSGQLHQRKRYESFRRSILAFHENSPAFKQLLALSTAPLWHRRQVKNVLVLVKNFWESHLLDESEIEILKNDGIAHRAAMHSYCFLYYSQPVLYGITTLPPILLDIIVPLNETRERIFIFHDCYGLDSQKYSS